MLQPRPLDVYVEGGHVDEFRAVAIGRGGDRSGQRLLAGLGPESDDLSGLHVRREAHDEVGEPLQLPVIHGQERMWIRGLGAGRWSTRSGKRAGKLAVEAWKHPRTSTRTP